MKKKCHENYSAGTDLSGYKLGNVFMDIALGRLAEPAIVHLKQKKTQNKIRIAKDQAVVFMLVTYHVSASLFRTKLS